MISPRKQCEPLNHYQTASKLGKVSFKRSMVERHFGVVGLQTVF